MAKRKILILVEGEKAEVKLMNRLFSVYTEFSEKYEIVSYYTNIYVLYNEFFKSGYADDNLDILQVLKEKETYKDKRAIFDESYTDILLIFDLDPHDSEFSASKIREMQNYFSESSDMGKLYINYPMVESFHHIKGFPDTEFKSRIVEKHELLDKAYKTRVHNESGIRDLRKIDREQFNEVIKYNVQKALYLLEQIDVDLSSSERMEFSHLGLLDKQLENYLEHNYVYVLCTCVTYIYV